MTMNGHDYLKNLPDTPAYLEDMPEGIMEILDAIYQVATVEDLQRIINLTIVHDKQMDLDMFAHLFL